MVESEGDGRATLVAQRGTAHRGTRGGSPAAGGPPRSSRPKLLSARVVVLVDKDDEKLLGAADTYVRRRLQYSAAEARAAVVPLAGWDALVPVLRRYAHIETLVLLAHGTPGSLGIGHRFKGLVDVATWLVTPMPVVGEVQFEACNVGAGPDGMIAFGRALSARRVMGYNHFLLSAPITVVAPKGVDVPKLQEKLEPYQRWMVPNQPTAAELARRPGTHVLTAEWFRDTLDEEELPKDLTRARARDLERTFKPRATMVDRRLTVAEATALAVDDLRPVVPLERIIIELGPPATP